MNRELPQDHHDGDWFTRQHVLVLVLLVATVTALYLCYLMAVPFLAVFTWAVTLAVIATPVHAWIESRLRYRDLAAGLTTVLVALLIIGPVAFVGHLIVTEIRANFEHVMRELKAGRWLQDNPALADLWGWAERNFAISTEVRNVRASVAGSLTTFVGGAVWTVIQLLLTLFTLYFLVRDRQLIRDSVRSLVPLSDMESRQFFNTVRDTIYATIYGSFTVALLQGVLCGLMFWILGLPGPVLWGVVMTLLAVVPNLGTFVIWVPAALLLFLEGSWTQGLILTAWGAIVVAMIDNLLYPYLVGNRMRIHTLAVFFAVLGGVGIFGAAGIVLGPVILAVTLGLIDVWRRRTAEGGTAEAGLLAPEIVPGQDQAIRELAAKADSLSQEKSPV
jgi:predicted PurR-regulated permease PerM